MLGSLACIYQWPIHHRNCPFGAACISQTICWLLQYNIRINFTSSCHIHPPKWPMPHSWFSHTYWKYQCRSWPLQCRCLGLKGYFVCWKLRPLCKWWIYSQSVLRVVSHMVCLISSTWLFQKWSWRYQNSYVCSWGSGRVDSVLCLPDVGCNVVVCMCLNILYARLYIAVE